MRISLSWTSLSIHSLLVLGVVSERNGPSRFSAKYLRRDDDPRPFPRLAKASSSDVEAALEVVDAAIAEMRVLNRARLDNPVRNAYRLAPGTKVSKRDEEDVNAVPPLLQITTEIASAAALVAEAEAAGQLDDDVTDRNTTSTSKLEKRASWWMGDITRRGNIPKAWGGPTGYKVFRDVTAYGADKSGKKDSTKAIMDALLERKRCAEGCNGSTKRNAIVYFPPGTYLVSSTIEIPFGTQLIGDAISRPLIKASSKFVGLGVLSTNKYIGGTEPGPDGKDPQYYVNTANFYRQIRNFKIDITDTDKDASVCAIHYQIAQATSLQFVELIADSSTTQQGIFSENGSGGVMSDVVFNGGAIGFYGGNQQFSADRMTFKNCKTAIQIIWDWGWVWKSLKISNSDVGFRLVGGDGGNIGSVSVMDSIMESVKTAMVLSPLSNKAKSGTTGLILDNTRISGPIKDTSGSTITAAGYYNNFVVGPVYKEGTRYFTKGSTNMVYERQSSLVGAKVDNLEVAPYYQRAKPQYEGHSASSFKSLKGEGGAKANGVDDDTKAVQDFFNKYGDGKNIIFVDAGVYVLTDTVVIPKNAKIVGEMWPQFAASGSKFKDASNPKVMLQVGNEGDVGSVEMQDLILTTVGGTAGAVLMEWNVKAAKQGSAGLFDVHARIGGADGTELTHKECPAQQSSPKAACQAASLMFHLKKGASGYFDNMWLWVADHTIDDPDLSDDRNDMIQCSIYVARGFLIESRDATWLYGTSSEHSVMYQYNFNGARNIFTTMIQTEEPYYQPSPKPPAPFSKVVGKFSGDPKYDGCSGDFGGCDEGWAVIVKKSQNIHIGGAGTYSWFSSYSQNCIDKHSCQLVLWDVSGNYDNVRMQHIIAIGAKYTMVHEGKVVLASADQAVSGHPQWSQISIFNAKSAGAPGDEEEEEGDDEKCSKNDRTWAEKSTKDYEIFEAFMLEPEYVSRVQYITVVNLTPYTFKYNKDLGHEYQIEGNFGDIPPGRSRQNVCRYAASGDEPKTDRAEYWYEVFDKNGKKLHRFMIQCGQHLEDSQDEPYRTIFDLKEWGLGFREVYDPHENVPVTWVITGSESYGYYHSLEWKASGDDNWMKQHLEVIKERQLNEIIVPGSHDSGMSTIQTPNVYLGNSDNTQTQGLNLQYQLKAGVRYLDFRVVSDGGKFWTAHINGITEKVIVGAMGESLDDAIEHINAFTSDSPGEVIILWVRELGDVGTSGAVSNRRWSAEKTDEFWEKMEQINNRCPNMDGALERKLMKHLVAKNGGNGCVIIVQDGWLADDVTKSDKSRGFYDKNQFTKFDHWSNTGDLENMINSQVEEYSTKANQEYMISQWVLTPSLLETALINLELFALYFSNPSVYFAALMSMTPEGFPNVIMQDYVGLILNKKHDFYDTGFPQLKTLALGVNLYLASENCGVDGRKHPFHKKSNAKTMAMRKSTWDGAIFANGTRIEETPEGWKNPFCAKVFRAGTRFGNGTVLKTDMNNPDCE